jgi:hypothetical protein
MHPHGTEVLSIMDQYQPTTRPTRSPKENPVVVRTRSKLVASDFVRSIVRNVRQVVAVVIAGVVRDESKSSGIAVGNGVGIYSAAPNLQKSDLLCIRTPAFEFVSEQRPIIGDAMNRY